MKYSQEDKIQFTQSHTSVDTEDDPLMNHTNSQSCQDSWCLRKLEMPKRLSLIMKEH